MVGVWFKMCDRRAGDIRMMIEQWAGCTASYL